MWASAHFHSRWIFTYILERERRRINFDMVGGKRQGLPLGNSERTSLDEHSKGAKRDIVFQLFLQ